MPYADHEQQLRANRERQKTPRGAANHARAVKAWRERSRKRWRAQQAVNNALRYGDITRWPVCAMPECCETKLQAHHADYDAPLSVIWLCDAHHKSAHLAAKGKGK